MFGKNTFCVMPWSSIQINPSGDFKICCFSGVTDSNSIRGEDNGYALDKDGNIMNVMTHSIMDAMNSEYHKELRIAQSKNERHDLCKVCWDRDDAATTANQPSKSLRVFRSFSQLTNMDNVIPIHAAEQHMKSDGSIDDEPISLDLRFTNICNMKCIMCSTKYSNQWYDDEIAIYGQPIEPKIVIKSVNNKEKGSLVPWHETDEWWSQFEKIKMRIRHLYITGGEPFIIKGHDIILDKLIESGIAKQVVLEYDTNLTVINDKILNKLKQFKEVIISVSCDDINDKFELIRFPGKFNTIIDNLEKLKIRNFKIRHISSCVGMYSFYSPIRVHGLFSRLGYNHFSFRFLRSPNHSDLAFLPDHLKLKVIEIYKHSQLPNNWKAFLCGYLENNIGKYSVEECESMVKKHIEFLNKLDELRGTDWKKTLPEVVELLKDYL